MRPRIGIRLVSLAAVGALVSACFVPAAVAARSGKSSCRDSIAGIDLWTATIPEVEGALADGKITSVQLVKAYLARIRAYDGTLDSIRTLNPDALKLAKQRDAELRAGESRGPLQGIPLLLKDNVNTVDMPTTAGSIALEGNIPRHEATITKKLEDAGAIILGKTNLSEFANWVDLSMPNGYSSLGGQVHNPYTGGDPSGSSSGSGVASAMAFASGTVGTETSGSILSPSNANSNVGIKPTTGLLSRFGIIPLAPSFDTAGPITRNVTDAAVMLSAMAGPDPKDERTAEQDGNTPPGLDYTKFLKKGSLKGVRLGYSDNDRDDLSDTQLKVFDQALDDLKKLGATLVETDEMYYTALGGLTEIGAIPNEFKASLNQYLADETQDLSSGVKTLTDIIAFNNEHPDKVKYGQNLLEASDKTHGDMNDPVAIANREESIRASQATIDGTFTAYDLDAFVAPGAAYANLSAAAGYPTVIVPAGYAGSAPLGVSFVGTGYTEPSLISYAYDYEQASHRRLPPPAVNERMPDLCT
ncbi:MAG TPA: amidase family protein [Actinomycetota bacterium]|nr:amidase family protein [Actinomycetota bacterium]